MDQKLLNSLFNTQRHIDGDELNAYLRGDATPDTRHKVEDAMLDESLYADAVEGYQEMGMTNLPELENFSDFKKKLPALDGAKIVQLTPAQRLIRIAAVAGILILAVIGYNALQPSTPDELFADFYSHYENDISLARRGDTVGMNSDFKNALGQYAVGEFASAKENFAKALEAEPANDAAHFFTGMSLIELGSFTQAIDHFTIVKSNNGTYARKAFWYSILASIKLGEIENAKGMLEEFVKTSGYMQKEASILKDKL